MDWFSGWLRIQCKVNRAVEERIVVRMGPQGRWEKAGVSLVEDSCASFKVTVQRVAL